MSWSTPKTDWNGETVDGVYTGDRFNAVDFNRIKNNLEYLRELAIKMYDEFAIQSVGSDKTVKDSSMLMKSMHWKRTSLPSIPTVSRGLTALLLPMPPMVIRWISKNSIVWREQSLTFTTGSPMRVREGGHSHGILV